MTVYEALVRAQHEACEEVDTLYKIIEGSVFGTEKYENDVQSQIDRAYLIGVAIDNLPVDVASREV